MGDSKKSSKKPKAEKPRSAFNLGAAPTKTVKAEKPQAKASLHSNEEVIKALSGKDHVTAVQLAAELKVTKTTAQVYLKRLAKTRAIDTKLVRQGLRGPKAIGFKIRAR